jgi:putative oxidoreductase
MTVAFAAATTGRALLSLLFIVAGLTKLAGPKPFLAHMAQVRVPGAILPLVALFEIGAGTALLVGWNMRVAAGLLCVFCIATALVFHLHLKDRAERTQFAKDLALSGALAMIAAGAVP